MEATLKRTTKRIPLPKEDEPLASVVQMIVRDFKGDVMAFYNQAHGRPVRVDDNQKTKRESAAVKKFVKFL
jgi:hypothetical protein